MSQQEKGIHIFPNFEYRYFVRYVANNCDSEQMKKSASDLDENFIVGNMKEYLDKFWRWGKVEKNYTASELNPEKKPGHPKQIDCVCFNKNEKYKLCIEVKFIRGDSSRFVKDIMSDVFRVKQLTGDNTVKGTRRCILIAGQRGALDSIFVNKKLGKILKFPSISKVSPEDSDLEEVRTEVIQKRLNTYYSVKEKYLSEYKDLDYYSPELKVQILGAYRPNKSSFLSFNRQDVENYIDVGLWEIKT